MNQERVKKINFKTNKKGFTLIELLAVIIILGIVMLIVSSFIFREIQVLKKEAFRNSVYGIIKTVENNYYRKIIENNILQKVKYKYTNGMEASIPNNYKLEYKGKKPQNGEIKINEKGEITLALHNGKYCAKKDYQDDIITLTEKKINDCNLDLELEEYVDISGANKPQLLGEMKAVIWNEVINEWVETTNIDDPEFQDWYDYENQKWANAQTKDGSMWVWVPRYAYQITKGYNSSQYGTIKIAFLKENTTTPTFNDNNLNIGLTPDYDNDKTTQTNYVVHPAFNFDDKQIMGFWVAKFEPSVSIENENHSCFIEDTNCDDINLIPAIIPNARAWRKLSIKTAYTVSLTLKEKSHIYGPFEKEVNSHLITNTEWGAVAYLSKSKYGAHNEEIHINNSFFFTTGCAGDMANSIAYVGDGNENIACQNEWHTEKGVKASSTLNIYGIYDLKGGSFEYVMGNLNKQVGESNFNSLDENEVPKKYIDIYTDYSNKKFGDAVFETSSIPTDNFSWYNEFSSFPVDLNPWFVRGGNFSIQEGAGPFSYYYSTGSANAYVSFRPTIITTK